MVGGSQYREYLNYIQTVGENSGFVVEEDMLRIPSTKRVTQTLSVLTYQGVPGRMVLVVNFFVFLKLLFFAL